MARLTLEKLIAGDSNIIEAYSKVRQKWNDLLKDFDFSSPDAVEKMARLVTEWQIPMEHLAGERWIGQEIMVIVGIGQFYSSEIGFDSNIIKAKIVYNGFLASMCSLEVKYHAETIGKLYGIDDYNEEDFNF